MMPAHAVSAADILGPTKPMVAPFQQLPGRTGVTGFAARHVTHHIAKAARVDYQYRRRRKNEPKKKGPHAPVNYHEKKAPRDAQGNRIYSPDERTAGLYLGQVVIGRVVESNVNGSKIQILERLKPHMETSPHEYGWMPTQERPLRLHDQETDGHREENPLLIGPPPIGLVRLFTVKVLPSTTTQAYSPRQSIPLLSAYQWDREMLWHRAFQLLAVCKEWRETVPMSVDTVVGLTLIGRAVGIPIIVPHRQLFSEEADASHEELKAKYAGKTIDVSVLDVEMKNQRLLGSTERARSNVIIRDVKVGDLLSGVIRRMTPRGCLVGINDTTESGMLHVSCISKAYIKDPMAVFYPGEPVHVLVTGYGPGHSSMSFSTAELEENAGDILHDRQKCWDNREKAQQRFLKYLESMKQAEQRPRMERGQGNRTSSSFWTALGRS